MAKDANPSNAGNAPIKRTGHTTNRLFGSNPDSTTKGRGQDVTDLKINTK